MNMSVTVIKASFKCKCNTKVLGSFPRSTQLIKCIPWMHCKSAWMNGSKCKHEEVKNVKHLGLQQCTESLTVTRRAECSFTWSSACPHSWQGPPQTQTVGEPLKPLNVNNNKPNTQTAATLLLKHVVKSQSVLTMQHKLL